MNKNKLRKLLETLSPFDNNIESTFASLDKEIADVSAKLKETITAKTLEETNEQFRKLKNTLKLEPIISAFEELKKSLTERDKKLLTYLQERLTSLSATFKDAQSMTTEEIKEKGEEITALRQAIEEVSSRKIAMPDFTPQIIESEKRLRTLISELPNETKNVREAQKRIKDLADALEELRKDTLKRMESIGGGNMNRQIRVDGSVMSTLYTDVNFQTSSSISFTAANDTTNRRVNVVASLLVSGGAGPGGGITRTVSVITANTTGAEAATTDYVYIASATGMTFTLPTAVGNTNSYVLKNFTGSSILVAVTAGQAIDQSATATMPTMNESLSFISNGSVWGVV